MHILVVVIGALLGGPVIHAASSFGGSCSAQGSWSRSALDQTKEIEAAVLALRDDPNCKGIESVLTKVSAKRETARPHPGGGKEGAATDLRASRLETIPGEISALREYLRAPGPLTEKVISLLAVKTMEHATAGTGFLGSLELAELRERAVRTADEGITLLDDIMATLPNYELCLNHHPNQALAIFGAAVQMAGAFASGGEGVTARLGNTIGNMVTFFRNQEFAHMLRNTNESRYWASMACLIETTSQTYCQAHEAYQLLEYQRREHDLREKFAREGFPSNTPLDGYYLLVRELPIVAEWLQKVQFGIKPKVTPDSNFKNTTLDSMNKLLKTVNDLQGTYSEQSLQYQTLTDLRSKQNYAIQMVSDLSRAIVNSAGGDARNPGNRNFFTTAIIDQFMPYYLLGLDKLPREVAGNSEGKVVMTFDQWVMPSGEVNRVFADPDEVVRTVGQRLDALIDNALAKGSDYFRQRMVVDTQNLVSESVTSSTVSVMESLVNIRKYLAGLAERLRRDPRQGAIILPSLLDTIQRVDKVVRSYEGVKLDLRLMDDGSVPEFDRKRVNQAYIDVISTAYDEFNVLLQRDGFLTTRLTTFVKFDYSDRIRRKENMSEYQQILLTIAGKGLLDYLVDVHQLNPAQTEVDLNAAQVVNTRNLRAVEDLLGDSLSEAISDLNRVGGGLVIERGWMARWSGPLSSLRSRYVLPSQRDDNRSFRQFRSQLCVQALAFEDSGRYAWLCEGSRLETRMQPGATPGSLSVSYDELQTRKRRGSGERAPYVCAFRRYLQENQAYWLTNQPR